MDHKESPQDLIKPIIKLFFSGQVQEALNDVETLINDFPNEPLLFNICGVFYKEIGQLDEAIKRFNKALAINPNYAEAHNNLGVTLQNLGLMDKAVISYENAITSCWFMGSSMDILGRSNYWWYYWWCFNDIHLY